MGSLIAPMTGPPMAGTSCWCTPLSSSSSARSSASSGHCSSWAACAPKGRRWPPGSSRYAASLHTLLHISLHICLVSEYASRVPRSVPRSRPHARSPQPSAYRPVRYPSLLPFAATLRRYASLAQAPSRENSLGRATTIGRHSAAARSMRPMDRTVTISTTAKVKVAGPAAGSGRRLSGAKPSAQPELVAKVAVLQRGSSRQVLRLRTRAVPFQSQWEVRMASLQQQSH